MKPNWILSRTNAYVGFQISFGLCEHLNVEVTWSWTISKQAWRRTWTWIGHGMCCEWITVPSHELHWHGHQKENTREEDPQKHGIGGWRKNEWQYWVTVLGWRQGWWWLTECLKKQNFWPHFPYSNLLNFITILIVSQQTENFACTVDLYLTIQSHCY